MSDVKAKTTENPMINVSSIKMRKNSVIATFSDTSKIDPLIEKVRAEVMEHKPDLTSKKGREAIASLAHKVSKMKTGVVSKMIAPSIEDAKAIVKNVGAGKKHFEAQMDALRDEVRKPLTEWQEAEKLKEKKRIADIQEKIAGISSIADFNGQQPSKDDVTSLIEAVDAIDCEQGFDEFTQDALQAKSKAKEILSEALNDIIKKELEEAAAEELRLKELELEKQAIKQKAQERLNNLMMIPVKLIGKPSVEIQEKINSLSHYEVPESEFGELYEQAINSVENVLAQLEVMLHQQIMVEESQQQEQPEEQPVVTGVDMGNGSDEKASMIVEQEQNITASMGAPSHMQQKEQPEEPIAISQQDNMVDCSQEVMTWHDEMIKDVKFWAEQYSVYGRELSDLIIVLNKYK